MRFLVWIALLLTLPVAAVAQNSPEHAVWTEGPVAILMTPAERDTVDEITNDRDLHEFAAAFWARRDPDLETRANEFRIDFEARVRAADRQFGHGDIRGALTDRGRTLVLLGLPSERRTGRIEPYLKSLYRDQIPEDGIQRNRRLGEEGDMAYRMRGVYGLPNEGPDAGIDSKARREGKISEEVVDHGIRFDRSGGLVDVWLYSPDQLSVLSALDADATSVRVTFFDHFASGSYAFEPGIRHGQLAVDVLQSTPESFILNPGIDEPPVYPLIDGVPRASAAQLAWFSDDDAPWPATATTRIVRGVRTNGDYPAWLFVCLPPGSPPAHALAGKMVDGHGLVQGTFQLTTSGRRCSRGTVYEASLPVYGTDVVLEFALVGEKGPIAVRRTAVNPAPSSDAEPFITSILAGAELHQPEIVNAGDPFVYGGHHLTPRLDGRYRTDEALSYFALIAAPGLEEDGQPNVWVALRVFQAGAPTPLLASPRRPAPLSAVAPGVFMVGSQLPLDALPEAGSYRLQVTVADAISGLQRTSSIPFTLE